MAFRKILSRVMNSKSDLYSASKPVRLLTAVLGLHTHSRLKNGNFKRSYTGLILATIYVSTYLTFFIKQNTILGITLQFQSSIINVTRKAFYLGNIALMCIVYAICHLRHKKYLNILKSMQRIDAEFRVLSLTEQLFEKNRHILTVMSVTVLVVYVFYFGVWEILAYWITFWDSKVRPVVYEYVFPMLVITAMKLQFFKSVLILRTRAEVLNGHLNAKVKNMKFTKRTLTSFYVFAGHLESIMKIHKKMVDTAKSVNEFFSLQMLLSCAMLFILYLSDGYVVLYTFTVGRNDELGILLINAFKLMSFHAVELLVSMRCCMMVCYQLNHTKDILHEVKISPDNSEAKNVVMVSIFQLMHDRLEITACELFRLDYSFIFSMAASLTTYLLIFLQFDLDAANHRTFGNTNQSLLLNNSLE